MGSVHPADRYQGVTPIPSTWRHKTIMAQQSMMELINKLVTDNETLLALIEEEMRQERDERVRRKSKPRE
jgi:hypothetical protein